MKRGRPSKCIFCHSAQTVRKGKRRTATQGTRQIWLCKNCGRRFTPRHQNGVLKQCPGCAVASP